MSMENYRDDPSGATRPPDLGQSPPLVWDLLQYCNHKGGIKTAILERELVGAGQQRFNIADIRVLRSSEFIFQLFKHARLYAALPDQRLRHDSQRQLSWMEENPCGQRSVHHIILTWTTSMACVKI